MTKCDKVSGVTKCLDGITYTELSFLHMSPALSPPFCLTKSPSNSSKDVKGFQRKKEKTPHAKVCVTALSRGTTTELKYQGACRESGYGD